MQSLDVFLSRLLPQVVGCPTPLATQALLDSAIEFCEETTIVQSTSEPQTAVAGVATYDIELPQQQNVAVVLKAWFGTTQLVPAPADQVDAILAYVNAAGTDTTPRGTPRSFYEFSPGVIGVYPVPDVTTPLAISARVATKPLRTATSVDDILFNDWAEGIVGGALGRLAGVPGQSFSNPSLSVMGYGKFWAAVGKANNISLRGRIRTSISVRGVAFA